MKKDTENALKKEDRERENSLSFLYFRKLCKSISSFELFGYKKTTIDEQLRVGIAHFLFYVSDFVIFLILMRKMLT